MSYYFKYNDIIVSDFAGFGVVSAEMPTIPDREISSKDIWKRNGEIFFGAKDSARTITVNINVRTFASEEYTQTIEDLKACFNTREENRLYIGSEDLYINAVVSKYNFNDVFISDSSYYGEGEIEFYCADPYFYKGDVKYYDSNSDEDLVNDGDIETYPYISVEFEEDSTFLQVDSENGSILIGDYPNASIETVEPETEVLNDRCGTLSDWTSVGNVVDEGAVGDTLVVNAGGYGLKPNISSTSDGWHGACYRRNLPNSVKDFEVIAWFEFYSNKLDNKDSSSDSSTSGNYKVTAKTALRIRSGKGTSYKILGTIPTGKTVTVTDISSGWGKVTYNGITGYCSMNYLKKITTSNYNYKTTANLNLRTGRSTKYKILITIPKGTSLNIKSISGGWGKTSYKGNTGYVSMDYVTKLATSSALTVIGKEEDDAEDASTTSDMLGLCELYGFDSNGNKLFKTQLLDNNYYYRDTKPSIYIGGKRVYTDNTKCPEPKTKKKDKDSKETVKVKSGDSKSQWNGFWGNFKIKRENDVWSVEINKCTSGLTVTKHDGVQNLKTADYPTGDLSYLVVYMAGYGSYKVQNMAITTLRVNDLSPEVPETYNPVIIKAGDVIDIDCKENMVYKNGDSFLQYLDIGSTFFPINPGETSLNIYSSTTQLSAAISFEERFN